VPSPRSRHLDASVIAGAGALDRRDGAALPDARGGLPATYGTLRARWCSSRNVADLPAGQPAAIILLHELRHCPPRRLEPALAEELIAALLWSIPRGLAALRIRLPASWVVDAEVVARTGARSGTWRRCSPSPRRRRAPAGGGLFSPPTSRAGWMLDEGGR
jgi:hypothetical protein